MGPIIGLLIFGLVMAVAATIAMKIYNSPANKRRRDIEKELEMETAYLRDERRALMVTLF
jgi:hypothetical protein